MKRAIAKILIEEKDQKGNIVSSEIITVEGGLKAWNEDVLVFQLPEGEATYPKDDVEDLKILDEVFVLERPVKLPEYTETKKPEVKVQKEAKEKTVKVEGELKAPKPGSPLETIVNICKANPTMSRKQILPLLKAALPDKSDGFISTYHQTAQKHL